MLFKKVFATVQEKDFFNFCDRAKAEGMDIDEAFTSIIHAYSTGAEILSPSKSTLKEFSQKPKHNQSADIRKGHNGKN